MLSVLTMSSGAPVHVEDGALAAGFKRALLLVLSNSIVEVLSSRTFLFEPCARAVPLSESDSDTEDAVGRTGGKLFPNSRGFEAILANPRPVTTSRLRLSAALNLAHAISSHYHDELGSSRPSRRTTGRWRPRPACRRRIRCRAASAKPVHRPPASRALGEPASARATAEWAAHIRSNGPPLGAPAARRGSAVRPLGDSEPASAMSRRPLRRRVSPQTG